MSAKKSMRGKGGIVPCVAGGVLMLLMLSACRPEPADLTGSMQEKAAQFLGGPDASALPDGIHTLMWQGDSLWIQVENGWKQGYSKAFHPNGRVHRQGGFRDDLPHGWWEEFDRSGALINAGRYQAGVRDGLWRFFGSVVLTGHVVLNAAPGTLLAEGELHDDAMNGWWRLFDAHGKLMHEGSFAGDVPDGHQRYFVDGLLSEEGNMSKGRRTGTWTRYGPDGEKLALDEW